MQQIYPFVVKFDVLVIRKGIFVNFYGLMRYSLTSILFFVALIAHSQTNLVIEGKTFSNTDSNWEGVNISRSVPTRLTFRNNNITSVNTLGYMLQAGDDEIGVTNNNLDGEIITGNKFFWNGTDMKSITHGLFTGHNINALIKYNYLDHVPMGIIRKSGNNMSDTGGGIAYNIIKSGAVGINIKGMSNVKIFNNTLYTDRTTAETWRGLIYIYTHIDVTPNSVSHGTKIYNNIFYTKNQTYCIQIADIESTIGLESDYNIFYCETGPPLFYYCGSIKTFSEWQALGYDTHSRVINPGFKDLVNFVPVTRLDYGKDLGTEWNEGLSVDAKWGTTDPKKEVQNGKWQVGAFVYKAPATTPTNQPPVINISSPGKSTAYIAPAAITIDANATDADGSVIRVEFFNGTTKIGECNVLPWSFMWKEVPEGTYSITAVATDNSNLRTTSDPVMVVVEKSASAVNLLPSVLIISPLNNAKLEAPASVSITANAGDPDGSVEKVEYYLGQKKIGESLEPPYNIVLDFDSAGVYEITARVLDNLYASAYSIPVRFTVFPRRVNQDIAIYPNPNHGILTVELIESAGLSDRYTISVVSYTGRVVYSETASVSETIRTINISDSPGGNYIVFISSGGKILSSKQLLKI